MARTTRENPVPTLSTRGESFVIRWFDGKQYSVNLGKMTKARARALRDLAAVALAGRGDWDPELAENHVVRRYLRDLVGVAPTANYESVEALIAAYRKHMNANCTSSWPIDVQRHLAKYLTHVGGLEGMTPQKTHEYLDMVALATSKATRNRVMVSISGLCRWMRKIGMRHDSWNPLKDIRQIREDRNSVDIVTWEGKDARQLLKAADTFRDGIAIWIAIYAGLRRSEIARLRWEDISDTVILVRKSKTGKQRQVPLAARLAAKLKKLRKASGKVVPWPDAFHGWGAAARRLVVEYLPYALPEIHKRAPQQFGSWNAFRHTFASQLAQKGHSLDLIAAWLGDSPTVCREHYARFVPKNKRDTRIDDIRF